MENLHIETFYSGLSGLQLPIPKYLFPLAFENVSRLSYYASLFNSIEINSSFYKIMQVATVAKWAKSVPEYFCFTFKLWKGITHINGLQFKKEDVAHFFKSINAVKKKKGCVLLQFPPCLTNKSISQLEKLLNCITEIDPLRSWKIAVEFRNKSWYHTPVYELLNFHKVGLVIQDIPKSATPFLDHPSEFIYVRFHGPIGDYRESYSEDFLNEYTTYIHEWLNDGKNVYVYFNNTMGDAYDNARTLKDKISTLCQKDHPSF